MFYELESEPVCTGVEIFTVKVSPARVNFMNIVIFSLHLGIVILSILNLLNYLMFDFPIRF